MSDEPMTGDTADGTAGPPSRSGAVSIHRIEQHRDGRGSVFEPLGPEALAGQRNVHVVLTAPGHVRGNHWHRRGAEVLAVRGPALVRYRERADAGGPAAVTDVEVAAGDVVAFRFPPGVAHAVLNTGTRECLLVAFRDGEHDPKGDDTVREILLRPTAEGAEAPGQD